MNGSTVRVRLRDGPWPLHDVASTRAVEAAALAREAPRALMQRAGEAVARLACAVAPHANRIQVLVGPGSNGGDGLVAAAVLTQAGRQVDVTLLADPEALRGDAAWAFAQARAAGVAVGGLRQAQEAADLMIDALLGIGASRPLASELEAAACHMNRRLAPVLAIDLPSGLNADTGTVPGVAVRADHTLSLLTLKPGLFTAQGRDHSGQVWFDSLGVDAASSSACAVLPGREQLRAKAERHHASHKGSFGDVVVIGGDRGMVGAAWLAARAALAAGAGRVFCSPLDEAAELLLPGTPELMGRRRLWLQPPAAWKTASVVCGCGGGGAVRAVLPALLAHVPRLVLDADALNAIAADSALQRPLLGRAARGWATVLTPHPLEAARLLGTHTADVQHNRLQAAQALVDRYSAVVVLKGSGTVVARPEALPSINPSGNAALSSAGTGDVLAGWIGGAWSATPPGADPWCDAFDTAVASVWRHGRAADDHLTAGGDGPLTASSLIGAMRSTRSC